MTTEDLKHREGFLEGVIEGITLYAIWKDGQQLVGCMQTPLPEVRQPYQEELAKIREKLTHAMGEQNPRAQAIDAAIATLREVTQPTEAA